MLALVMCLLVLAIAGAAVLHGAAPERPSKRTATEPAGLRDRRRPRPEASRPAAATVARRPRRLRAGCMLALASIGIGVVAGLLLGFVLVGLGLALRSL